jgi:hypothetical protein
MDLASKLWLEIKSWSGAGFIRVSVQGARSGIRTLKI